jgi:hypothetical protein
MLSLQKLAVAVIVGLCQWQLGNQIHHKVLLPLSISAPESMLRHILLTSTIATQHVHPRHMSRFVFGMQHCCSGY